AGAAAAAPKKPADTTPDVDGEVAPDNGGTQVRPDDDDSAPAPKPAKTKIRPAASASGGANAEPSMPGMGD
ncbi:MAG TPA: hypothetical protein VH309_00290, partial [Elusimicrobiota bacterium]|nr:hypothetical protein [Elusimicrobiota bacterium]